MKPEAISPPAIVQPAENAKAELVAAFASFEESGRKRLEAALTIGRILADKKRQVGHGNWLKWLGQHFIYGRHRAADFIRVHESRGKCSHAATFEEALRLVGDAPEETELPAPRPAPNVAAWRHLEPAAQSQDEPPTDDESGDTSDGDEEAQPETTAEGTGAVRDGAQMGEPFVVPQGRPSWMKPGNNSDPDHPFADILSKMTALSAAITRTLAAADDPNDEQHDDAKKLRDYLTAVQVAGPKQPPLVFHQAKMLEGKHKGAKFIGLQPLRRLVRSAGMVGKKRDATVVKEFTEPAEDDE